MEQDRRAAEMLKTVHADWLARGPLARLCEEVGRAWRTNLDRQEPDLGDDALVLGIQCSRNILNRCVQAYVGHPHVIARDRKTLEMTFEGRTLHVSKAPSARLSWDVWQMDWSSSDVRDEDARVNSAMYHGAAGTIPGLSNLSGLKRDPSLLQRLHFTWQGLPDGSTRSWLGFPALGLRPWFAVSPVQAPPSGGRGGVPVEPTPRDPRPTFDRMAEPTIRLVRRPQEPASGDGS